MNNFKEQQLEILKNLGNVLNFSYNLQVINKLAKTKPKTLVKMSENFYNWQIEDVSENIIQKKCKVIFLAGPSASGKTTTAKKICGALKKRGFKARVVSMDDFFVNKVDTPLKADGSYDFENITAIDMPYFKKFIKNLLSGKTANLPKYNFVQGERTSITRFKLSENEIVLIEGLHALNPIIFKNISHNKIYKIFVTVSSNFTQSEDVVAMPRDLRLMRRLLRDYYTRGISVSKTIELWKNVCIGEAEYILPFRSNADYIINTTHMFEPLLYDKYLQPILANENQDKNILKIKEIFDKTGSLQEEYLPKSSLIREFLPKK